MFQTKSILRSWGPQIGVQALLACGFIASAAPPAWWAGKGVTNANPANSHGAANAGQGKHVALQAVDALEDVLGPGAAEVIAIKAKLFKASPGASTGVFYPTIPSSPDPAWEATQREPLTVGALKAMAAPFYEHLGASYPVWMDNQLLENELHLNGTHHFTGAGDRLYPWNPANNSNDAINYSAATIGQLKAVFALRFEDLPPFVDGDGDGLSKEEEEAPGTGIGTSDGNIDSDSDDLPDAWEYRHGLDPTSDSGGNGADGDPDGDHFTNLVEYRQGTEPFSDEDFPAHFLILTRKGDHIWEDGETGNSFATEQDWGGGAGTPVSGGTPGPGNYAAGIMSAMATNHAFPSSSSLDPDDVDDLADDKSLNTKRMILEYGKPIDFGSSYYETITVVDPLAGARVIAGIHQHAIYLKVPERAKAAIPRTLNLIWKTTSSYYPIDEFGSGGEIAVSTGFEVKQITLDANEDCSDPLIITYDFNGSDDNWNLTRTYEVGLLRVEISPLGDPREDRKKGVSKPVGASQEYCLVNGMYDRGDMPIPDLEDEDVTWQVRKMKSDGTFDVSWSTGIIADGKEVLHTETQAGIFQVRALVDLGGLEPLIVDYTRVNNAPHTSTYPWENPLWTSSTVLDAQKVGFPDYIGIYSAAWQENARQRAMLQLGSRNYKKADAVKVTEYYTAPAATDKDWVFTYHTLREAGLWVPLVRVPSSPYAATAPPYAIDWWNDNTGRVDSDSNVIVTPAIPGWDRLGDLTAPQPGWVIARPDLTADPVGYNSKVGILDYDGSWIMAGEHWVQKHGRIMASGYGGQGFRKRNPAP
ncbi:hypothetical protein [Luteolibacter sp. Populi]|uniref:hypothetical protein n=1 Tax=Luteolibacter sp. Populi TaxID=3230487 RepID=UPI0034673A4A